MGAAVEYNRIIRSIRETTKSTQLASIRNWIEIYRDHYSKTIPKDKLNEYYTSLKLHLNNKTRDMFNLN